MHNKKKKGKILLITDLTHDIMIVFKIKVQGF